MSPPTCKNCGTEIESTGGPFEPTVCPEDDCPVDEVTIGQIDGYEPPTVELDREQYEKQ